MSRRWLPCKRRDFVRKLRGLGFEGPYQLSNHAFMAWKQYRLPIPSDAEYSVGKLRELVREVEGLLELKITGEEWNRL